MTAISLNCWSESDQKAIREQLVRILNSGPFHQSQRRQRFLEYLVNETLAGRGERLKGYNVALEVFDRPETFDPTVDPLVRIEAARLREKLREYYGTEGQSGSAAHSWCTILYASTAPCLVLPRRQRKRITSSGSSTRITLSGRPGRDCRRYAPSTTRPRAIGSAAPADGPCASAPIRTAITSSSTAVSSRRLSASPS